MHADRASPSSFGGSHYRADVQHHGHPHSMPGRQARGHEHEWFAPVRQPKGLTRVGRFQLADVDCFWLSYCLTLTGPTGALQNHLFLTPFDTLASCY